MLEYRLLGPFEVRRNGEIVDIGPRKAREVLALLLLADRAPVSMDRIQSALWEENPPKTARGSVHVYVSQLRSQLGTGDQSVIEHTDAGYRIRPNTDAIDVGRFDAIVQRGLGLLADDHFAEALRALDEALGMVQGEPLADFAYKEFAQPYIGYIRQHRASALEARLEARLALGSHRQVAAEARQLLHEDPFNEAIWAALMTALYRSQRRTEALRTFQIATSRLAEAGLEPTERLTHLEDRILTQDSSLDPPMVQPPNNLPDLARRSAPAQEVTRLARDLDSASAVTLIGPSEHADTIAIEAGRASLERFPDGVWLVDVSNRIGAEVAVRATLDALGVIAGPQPRRTLAEYTDSRSLLVILTGADGVASDLGWLASEVATRSPGSRVVLTVAEPPPQPIGLTRQLRLAEPRDLPPTSSTNEVLLGRMSYFAGPVTINAIRQIAGFEPIDATDIDYLLGGLVADGKVLADNSELTTRFTPADRGGRVVHPSNRELVASRHLEYCTDLSGRILSGLFGPARREALNAAAAEHAELKIAIDQAVSEGRQDDALLIGHAAGHYWSTQGSHLGEAVSVLSPVATGITNQSIDAVGVHLTLGFAHFRSGSYDDALRHFDQAVEMSTGIGDSVSKGRALAERGHLRMFLGDHTNARNDFDEARSLAELAGSPALRARVMMLDAQLGMRDESTMGQPHQRDQLIQVVDTFQRLGHGSAHANSLLVLSSWYIDTDDPSAAVAQAEEALEIAQLGADRSMLAFALARRAEAFLATRQFGHALSSARESLALADAAGNKLVGTLALLSLAGALQNGQAPNLAPIIATFRSFRAILGVPITPRESLRLSNLRTQRNYGAHADVGDGISMTQIVELATQVDGASQNEGLLG